jgi:hypothetical protein
LAKGDYLLSVFTKKAFDPNESKASGAYTRAVVASAGGWRDPALRPPEGAPAVFGYGILEIRS